jgi:pyrroline-5-carboxylate reductase
MNMKKNIAIIGGGNMGQAFARGLLRAGVPARGLVIADPSPGKLRELKKQNVAITADNAEAARAGVVILAVKPQVLPEVARGLRAPQNTLVISLAAGVPLAVLQRLFSDKQPIVRVMPNIAATVGESMSVWVRNSRVRAAEARVVKKILNAVGKDIELKNEKLVDAATAISGSGPAYVCFLAEHMAEAGRRLSLSAHVADLLVRQTLIGTARYMATSADSPRDIRASVTSKGGTTEAALMVFKKAGLSRAIVAGAKAAAQRARELGVQ